MSLGVIGLGLAFAVAGVLQVYIERVLGQGFLTAQAQMQFWFRIVMFFGVFVLLGALVNAWSLARGRGLPPAGGPLPPD